MLERQCFFTATDQDATTSTRPSHRVPPDIFSVRLLRRNGCPTSGTVSECHRCLRRIYTATIAISFSIRFPYAPADLEAAVRPNLARRKE